MSKTDAAQLREKLFQLKNNIQNGNTLVNITAKLDTLRAIDAIVNYINIDLHPETENPYTQ